MLLSTNDTVNGEDNYMCFFSQCFITGEYSLLERDMLKIMKFEFCGVFRLTAI